MKITIGVLLASLASTVGADSITLLAPCRVVDTRTEPTLAGISGPLTNLRVYRMQGKCGIPEGATGVLLNVTATQATVAGHLALASAELTRREGSVVPPTSTVNFAAGETKANFAITAIAAASSTESDLLVYPYVPSGEVHVILDVVGYLK